MSTKGQIVIPHDLREDFNIGEKLVVIKNDGQLIIKQASAFDKNVASDIEFAKRTQEALTRYNQGKFVEKDFDEFIDDMKQW